MSKRYRRKSQFSFKIGDRGKLELSDALRWLLVITSCLAFAGGSNPDRPLVAQVAVMIIDRLF